MFLSCRITALNEEDEVRITIIPFIKEKQKKYDKILLTCLRTQVAGTFKMTETTAPNKQFSLYAKLYNN